MIRCAFALLTILAGAIWAKSPCGDAWEINPYRNNFVVYHNIVAPQKMKKGDNFSTHGGIGKVRPKPQKKTLDEANFTEGQKAYAAGDFVKASLIFETMLKSEPSNPFLLDALARTLYHMESRKQETMALYAKLLRIIDEGYLDSQKFSVTIQLDKTDPEGGSYVVDPWFIEPHWKLGTLYMDTEQYQLATFHMLMAYLFWQFDSDANIEEENRLLAVQIVSFLTEAFFFLKDQKNNAHYYCRTLELDPENKYVRQFRLKPAK